MKRRVSALGLLLFALGCFGACASKSNNTSGATTTPQPDSGSCTRECCELPQPGTTCTAEAGATCTYAITCAEGLVLSRETTCQGGLWQATNDCPAAGALDKRGCPGAQPANGTPCTIDPTRGSTQCGYSKTCSATLCDGGNCVPVHTSAQATCVNGMWQTTPLGPC
jgi:hypothetical protein